MFWKVIHRMVDLTFLILSITTLGLLLNITNDNATSGAFKTELKEIRQEMQSLSDNTLKYLEGRVNKLAEVQDIYQSSTHQRISLMEQRIKALEAENKGLKSQVKAVNNVVISNSANNIVR